MLFYFAGMCITLFILWWWFKKGDGLEPPELPGRLPILGHGLLVLGDSVDMFNAVVKYSAVIAKMGGVAKMYIGPVKIYGVTNPEDCLTVLNECTEKHYLYEFMKPITANGIFTADVHTWERNRRLLNPAFSQHVLDEFIEVFNARAKCLVKRFEDELGKSFDHEHYLKVYTLETICATSLGISAEEFNTLNKNYLPHLMEAQEIVNTRMKTIWLHLNFLFNLSHLKKRLDEVVKSLNDFADTIIEKKRLEMNKTSFSEINKTGKQKPFIDLLIELSKDHVSMTDIQIRSEISTLLLAGHESNAVTLTFALALLGSYPDVQEKAYQEIREVLGNTNRYISKDDLSKLVYIEAILKETLRLYPAAPILARQLNKDIKLKNYTLKAGHGCLLLIYGSGRHAMWGPDANDFRPERWLDKDSLPPAKYFASFGLGRRSCTGKTYAMMSMKITLAHVIRSYLISADVSKMVVKMDVLISPHEGSNIVLKRRC